MQTILITGATDGIGLALAVRYAARGWRLVLVGKRPLTDLHNALFTSRNYCQVNLADPDCHEQLLAWLGRQGIDRLDVVVHNAGVGSYGTLTEQTPAEIDTLLAVNLYAPIRLSHALLPWLPPHAGKMVFVSSVAAGLPAPAYAVYAAAKAALESFARNLRWELAGGLQVQIVRPGATRTGMHAKAGIPRSEMDWTKFPPAEQVADGVAAAIDRGRPLRTLGVGNRLLALAGRWLPGLLVKVQRRREVSLADANRRPWQAQQPLVLITGAADGIGRALALRWAAGGADIIGVDIDGERARQTQAEIEAAGAKASFILADLAAADGWQVVVDALGDRRPTAVIHNAGISGVGLFTRLPLTAQLRVLDLNLRTPLQLTAALLRRGKLAAPGSVLFVSSLSHFVDYPGAAVYAASKDGLAAFGVSLSAALPAEDHVMVVYPGPTRTAHARRYSPDNSRESSRMTPAALADDMFRASRRGRRTHIPGLANKLFALLGRVAPGVTAVMLRRQLLDRLAGDVLLPPAGNSSTDGEEAPYV